MNARTKTLEALAVAPGSAAALADRDPAWAGGPEFDHLDHAERRQEIDAMLARSVVALEAAHELLWASDSHALLIVLQAMDAAGKDGTVRHVMSGVNPSGVHRLQDD